MIAGGCRDCAGLTAAPHARAAVQRQASVTCHSRHDEARLQHARPLQKPAVPVENVHGPACGQLVAGDAEAVAGDFKLA